MVGEEDVVVELLPTPKSLLTLEGPTGPKRFFFVNLAAGMEPLLPLASLPTPKSSLRVEGPTGPRRSLRFSARGTGSWMGRPFLLDGGAGVPLGVADALPLGALPLLDCEEVRSAGPQLVDPF